MGFLFEISVFFQSLAALDKFTNWAP